MYTKESLYALFVDLDVTSCLTPMPDKAEELIDYVLKLQEENQKLKSLNLIKYLEDKIKENQRLVVEHKNERKICDIYLAKVESYQNILERVKNGKYE